jgi:hypothetical protein
MSSLPGLPPRDEEAREPDTQPESTDDRAIDLDAGPMDEPPALVLPPYSPEGYFATYAEQLPPPPRFPNVVDVGLMLLVLLVAWFISGMLMIGAVRIHLFGVFTLKQAAKDVRYNLGGQAILYFIALAGWSLLFRGLWHRPFLRVMEWRVSAAVHARWRIVAALFMCLGLALIDSIFLPGPAHAPIEDAFKQPGAVWLLFGFGITLAPFVEEMIFRGFLLSALCTAWDWMMERIQNRLPPEPEEDGKTRWSLPAMIAGSLLTSVPFALIHAPQTAWSFGPFILLVCVSLAFCWIRLSTRSLAASTAVHACYNFALFMFMYIGTGGFKHMDKM